jgi:hypothetical protein
MRHLFLAGAVGLCLATGASTDLSTDYARVRTLRTTSELELDLETTLMEMTVDDQPVEDQGPGGGSSSSLVRKCVRVDEFLEAAEGAPSRVKRTFEVLHDNSSFSFGEDERTDERDYPLQGVTLELVHDAEGTRIELVDGPKPDDAALLEGHELALGLDGLLPEGSVELEASWELEHEALQRALSTAIDAKLFAEGPPPERTRGGEGERGGGGRGPGRGRGGAGRNLGLLQWEGKAKLVALEEEHAGLPCARIELELEGKGDLPEMGGRGGQRGGFFLEPGGAGSAPATAFGGTISAKLTGSLFVSLAERRPVALVLDGELQTENRFEREREGQRFSSHSVQSGRLTLNVKIEGQ